jgi:hypothetical protein
LKQKVSDERLRKTSELFMGIKLLKLLGWELAFAEHVTDIREKELKLLRKDAIYVALNSRNFYFTYFCSLFSFLFLTFISISLKAFITQGSSIVVTLVTFSLFPYIEGQPLTSAKVFTGLALFNQITVPLYIIPLVCK